jgi:hypothetical protein
MGGGRANVPPRFSLTAKRRAQYGVSSIGRVAVSKTVGWGFESLTPCQFLENKSKIEIKSRTGGIESAFLILLVLVILISSVSGEVAEWSIAAVLKTALA